MCGLRNAEKKFNISPLVFPEWRLEYRHATTKDGKSYVKVVVIWFLKHTKQNSNCYTYVVRVDLFNNNNIHVVRCRHDTGNKYGGQKSGSSFSLARVAHILAM